MKVNRYNGFKIILIGAGGTGGYIAPHLYRIAFASGMYCPYHYCRR